MDIKMNNSSVDILRKYQDILREADEPVHEPMDQPDGFADKEVNEPEIDNQHNTNSDTFEAADLAQNIADSLSQTNGDQEDVDIISDAIDKYLEQNNFEVVKQESNLVDNEGNI